VADDLTEQERELAGRLAENPLDMFRGKSLGWLEDFIRITVGGGSRSGSGSSGVSAAYYVPGDVKTTLADLTAQTGEYVFEDDSGRWLYCNGVAVSQTTYADLYAAIGANAYGTDSGGNFFLPDPRGRALFFTGTHADTDLGDSDGVTLASRRPKHQHTVSGTTSSDSAGTPAGTISGGPYVDNVGTGNFDTNDPDATAANAVTTNNPTFTGSAMSGHSHTVSGTAGSGMSLDAPAYLFIGSLLVRF
jgi:microcystin-dependent protein